MWSSNICINKLLTLGAFQMLTTQGWQAVGCRRWISKVSKRLALREIPDANNSHHRNILWGCSCHYARYVEAKVCSKYFL
jgi:hypothetical protein